MDAGAIAPTTKPPQVSKELAEWLRENYQPRGYNPVKETEAAHHFYRGMVDMADYLIACYEQGLDSATGLDVNSEPAQGA